MSSMRTTDNVAKIPFFQVPQTSGPHGWNSMFFAEDGWIFLERPGKRVECVCRYDEAIDAEALNKAVWR